MPDYTLIRSDRKTLALEIARDGRLIVRAPLRMSLTAIDHFVAGRADWIAEKQRLMLARRAAVQAEGETQTVWYLGRQYTLRHYDERDVRFTEDTMLVPRNWSREKLRSWLKQMCRAEIVKRVPSSAASLGVQPTAVHVTEAKTRWGSCSGKNSLNFAWRLIFCPPDVIDYVVIHELCHIRYKNHSSAFWNLVAQYDPAYQIHKDWLREHAALMDLF